jgi:hypothetical protein
MLTLIYTAAMGSDRRTALVARRTGEHIRKARRARRPIL